MSIELHLEQFWHPPQSLLCSLFQAAAYDTWERVAFSRSTPGLKIHETTITQNLVYEMNLIKMRMRILELNLFESRNEATNGHDLEIKIQQRDGWVTYWIQSKILYHSIRKKKVVQLGDGRYPQLPHRVGRRLQVDILLRRAREEKAVPLYLLYNFVKARMPVQPLCGLHVDRSQYGLQPDWCTPPEGSICRFKRRSPKKRSVFGAASPPGRAVAHPCLLFAELYSRPNPPAVSDSQPLRYSGIERGA